MAGKKRNPYAALLADYRELIDPKGMAETLSQRLGCPAAVLGVHKFYLFGNVIINKWPRGVKTSRPLKTAHFKNSWAACS
jgi:hypothetical protein